MLSYTSCKSQDKQNGHNNSGQGATNTFKLSSEDMVHDFKHNTIKEGMCTSD